MTSVRARLWLLAGTIAAVSLVAVTLGAGLHDATAQGSAPVTIVDFAFEPALIGIAPGATVTWTNAGAEPHTVTADDSGFNSGRLGPGNSYSQTFATVGSFTYRCRIHPSMTGTIVVNGGREASAKGAGPEAVPVVGVGTGALGQSGAVAALAGVAAVVLGAASLAIRRA